MPGKSLLAHCIVPEKLDWHFVCQDDQEEVSVIVKVFDDSDPRNCMAELDFSYAGEHLVNSHQATYPAGKPVIRRTEAGHLEFLLGFGRQNHFAAMLSDEPISGMIEFAGGPSWELTCTAQD